MARGKQKRIKPVAGAQTDQNSSHFLTQMPVVINPRIMPIIETDETLNVKPETMPNMKLKVESVVEPGIKSETKPGGKHGAGPATEQASKLKPKRKKKKKFNVVQAWQTYWGKGELTDWQRLCGDLGADGDLSSKDKCKEALKDVWINVHDFVKTSDKQDVKHFTTELELVEYTCATEKLYPRDMVQEDSPLELLLARIGRGALARLRQSQLQPVELLSGEADELKMREVRIRKVVENNKPTKPPKKYEFVPPPQLYR